VNIENASARSVVAWRRALAANVHCFSSDPQLLLNKIGGAADWLRPGLSF
jgi:hypothetical protein